MSVLVDTNILSRIAERDHPQNAAAAKSVQRLITEGELLCIVPQNVYEFWVVATRPIEQNGLGMTTADAKAKLDDLMKALEFLPDEPAIFPKWQELVVTHDCKGKSAHDARIIAAMNIHGVTRILTFNSRDFSRYPGVAILDPTETVAETGQ